MSPKFSSVLISHAGADDKWARNFRAAAGRDVTIYTNGAWEIEHVSIIAQQPIRDWSLQLACNTVRHAWLNLKNELSLMTSREVSNWVRKILGLTYTNLVAAVPNASNTRTSQLEKILTLKHIAAWRSAALIGAGVALVLESDARQIYPIPQLMKIIKFVSEAREPTFVFLSTPFSDEELGIVRGKTNPDLGLQKIFPPRSNTACCYILNPCAARILVNFDSKAEIEIRADWLLNKAFSERTFSVFFTNDEIIQNSSLTWCSSSIRSSPRP